MQSIEIGPLTIKMYSVMIFIGIIVAFLIIKRESKKWNIPENFISSMAVTTIIFGIVGARIYYVLFNFEYYSVHVDEIIKIWQGGLAIHGGIIFGLITILCYAWKYKVNKLRLLDIVVLGLIIAQAIGRWGNFFNGEAYGAATTLETLQAFHLPNFIINGMLIDEVYYIPTFLIESIWCLLGFIFLLIIKNRKYNKIGQVTASYLIWYGVGRLFIEVLRMDSLMLGNFKIAQIVSIAMVVIGTIMFIKLSRGSKFENLYNDIENGEKIVY